MIRAAAIFLTLLTFLFSGIAASSEENLEQVASTKWSSISLNRKPIVASLTDGGATPKNEAKSAAQKAALRLDS